MTAVEAEEDYLVNTLQRRLMQLNKDKSDIEAKLEMEQGVCVHACLRMWRLVEGRWRGGGGRVS